MPPKKCEARNWIIVLAGREAVHWVLAEGKMGFVASRRREVGRLTQGDGVFLYATKGTLGAEGILFASGHATSGVAPVDVPYKIAKRDVDLECDLVMDGVAEPGAGVAIAELVPQLRLFAGYGQPSSWRALLQRPLVSLHDPTDPEIINGVLEPLLRPPTPEVIEGYAPLAS
jgi:hypothetical protein